MRLFCCWCHIKQYSYFIKQEPTKKKTLGFFPENSASEKRSKSQFSFSCKNKFCQKKYAKKYNKTSYDILLWIQSEFSCQTWQRIGVLCFTFTHLTLYRTSHYLNSFNISVYIRIFKKTQFVTICPNIYRTFVLME